MLKEVSDNVEKLNLPPLAFSRTEKEQMYNMIMKGQDPLTSEGLVIYKMDKDKPIKVKKTQDHDVKIVGTFKPTPGSKYEGEAIGGFIGIPEGSSTPIRIGSGLDDETRKDAYENPEDYIGN